MVTTSTPRRGLHLPSSLAQEALLPMVSIQIHRKLRNSWISGSKLANLNEILCFLWENSRNCVPNNGKSSICHWFEQWEPSDGEENGELTSELLDYSSYSSCTGTCSFCSSCPSSPLFSLSSPSNSTSPTRIDISEAESLPQATAAFRMSSATSSPPSTSPSSCSQSSPSSSRLFNCSSWSRSWSRHLNRQMLMCEYPEDVIDWTSSFQWSPVHQIDKFPPDHRLLLLVRLHHHLRHR